MKERAFIRCQQLDISCQKIELIPLSMAFNGRFVLNLAHLASRNGGNISEIISLSGKSVEELKQEECMVEDSNYNAVIEHVIKTTQDNHFGLHAGENLNLSAAGLILQISQSCNTVKEALDLSCQYANLGCSVLPMQLAEQKDNYKIVFSPDPIWRNSSELSFQHTAAGVIAFKIKEFNSLTRMKHYPIKVELGWKTMDKVDEFERVYGTRVHFGAKETVVYLSKQHLEEKVITSNYNLLQILVAHAEEISSGLSLKNDFPSIVKQSIIKLVKPYFPTIEEVASHLNISARTLQRRLGEVNLTYKELLDDLKKDFAFRYLKKRDLSINEVAYLLGYGDGSAFSRSFKRWTGQSPRDYQLKMNQ